MIVGGWENFNVFSRQVGRNAACQNSSAREAKESRTRFALDQCHHPRKKRNGAVKQVEKEYPKTRSQFMSGYSDDLVKREGIVDAGKFIFGKALHETVIAQEGVLARPALPVRKADDI